MVNTIIKEICGLHTKHITARSPEQYFYKVWECLSHMSLLQLLKEFYAKYTSVFGTFSIPLVNQRTKQSAVKIGKKILL